MNTESLNFLIGYTENNEILIGKISKRYCDIDNKTTFFFIAMYVIVLMKAISTQKRK